MDRNPCAGQVLEVLGVVLVPEHVHRPAALERGADAVGADELLGVAEPGCEAHLVEVPLEVSATGEAAEDEPGGVGQDDADRLAVELLGQAAQHRSGAAGQRGVEVGVMQVGQVDSVGGHPQAARAPPGRQDWLAHPRRLDSVGREEAHPRLGQPIGIGPVRRTRRCQRHSSSCLSPERFQLRRGRKHAPGSLRVARATVLSPGEGGGYGPRLPGGTVKELSGGAI